jgi:sec-independent protein translocase protein TatC
LNPPKTDLPQPLVEHLDEFRRRALVCLWWFLIFSAIGYSQVDRVVDWLAKPVGDFIFSSPGEAFFIRFRIAFGLGGACTVPIVIYQVWRFVEISLGARERRWVRAIIPASCILFFVGVALALFVVAPVAVHFLLQFTTPHLKPLISISDYLSFLFWMLIGFGILFQLPIIGIAAVRVEDSINPPLIAAAVIATPELAMLVPCRAVLRASPRCGCLVIIVAELPTESFRLPVDGP